MKKIKTSAIKSFSVSALLLFIAVTAVINAAAYADQPADSNKNLYIYTLKKAVSFDSATAEKFEWLEKQQKYFELGIIAAGGGKLPADDTFIKLLDTDYYKRNTDYFYYNIPFNSINEFTNLNENPSVQNYIDIINRELTKLAPTLRAGNAEVSAFFLGALSKYFTNLALWPYAMGAKSPLGAAKPAVSREYFNELDKLIISDNKYKIDSIIEFDGLKKEFDLRDAVVNMIKFTAFDVYNPEPYKSMNAVTMYNLLPLSDALNKKVTLYKNIDSLSGEYVSYMDWEDNYIRHIAGTLSYCINYLYELTAKIPALDTRPPVEIAKLKYEPFDRRIRLYWDLNINRRVDRQLIYRWNIRRNVWEFVGAAPGGAQSYIVDNLENGRKYIFKVTAQEHLRPESEGMQIEALAVDNAPPAKPPKLVLHPMNGAFSLKLSARQNDSDLRGYFVYLYDDSDVLIRNIELPKNFGTATIDNLRNKKKYKVAVTAVDDALNESIEASIDSVTPADTVPPLPVINLKGIALNNKISINWAQPATQHNDIEKQIARLYDSSKKILREFNLAPGVNSYLISDVLNEYTYKIGITNVDGAPNYSPEKIIEVTPELRGGYFKFDNADWVIDNISPYIITADIENKGFEDILGFDESNQILILKNNNGQFEKSNTGIRLAENSLFKKMIIEDFNGSGKFDILALDGGQLFFYRHNADGKFEDISRYITIHNNGNIKQVLAVDINKDNQPDLLISYNTGEIALYGNTGNFNFALLNAEYGIALNDRFSYLIPVDYNNDGYTDFIAQTVYPGSANNLLLLINSKSRFERKTIIPNASLDIISWTIKDFNFDGRPDIFISFAGAQIGEKILNNILLLNSPDKGFVFSYKNSPAIDIENIIYLAAGADINADNKPDIVTYSSDNKIKIWRNSESFVFGEFKENPYSTVKGAAQLLTADIDGDGDMDIILSFDNKIQIYYNKLNSYRTKKK